MPTADLITRARSAETVEDECDVIDDALQVLWRGKLNEIHALYDLIDNVRIGRLPRAVLLGVVAALVPEGKWLRSGTRPSGAWAEWSEWNGCYSEAPTPALALLIAILEAAHVEA